MTNWFITGISRGLGKALAEAALARGDRVVGTTRDGKNEIAAARGTLHVLPLEVSDALAIESTVAKAFQLAGGLDVIVNNAAYGLLGAIENASDAEVARLFDVNVFGTFRVIRAALPKLRLHAFTFGYIASRARHQLNVAFPIENRTEYILIIASGSGRARVLGLIGQT